MGAVMAGGAREPGTLKECLDLRAEDVCGCGGGARQFLQRSGYGAAGAWAARRALAWRLANTVWTAGGRVKGVAGAWYHW